MKLFTNMTKPLVLFVLLFALGVGQMWGTARTFKSGEKIYFKDASGNITWGDLDCLWKVSNGNVYAYFWNDTESAISGWATTKYGTVNKENTIYEITVPGSGKEYTNVLFTRGDESNKWWNQTVDQTPEVGYNLFCIANDGDYDEHRSPQKKWKGNWSRYAHDGALIGEFNNWNPDTYPLSNSGVKGALVPLAASTTYKFKILLGETYYGINSASLITSTLTTWWTLYSGQGDLSVQTDVAGDYGFAWNASSKNMTVYYPKALYPKNKYIYFDVRNETYWNANPFTARFYLKYFDSGSNLDGMPLECSTPIEENVYYAVVPDNGYIGQIQMNRWYNGGLHGIANVAYVYNRSTANQNCLKEESGKENYEDAWTPQWTTYCPPMSDVDLEEDGTTLSWGGDGSSGTPYLIPTGASIKVKATNATKAVDDDNMTIYYQFKKAGTEVQAGSTTASATITASGSTGTKEAVTVEAYNYYNSTSGTHLASNEIYYEVRTPYTISYNAGTGGSGLRASETKLKGVNFATPNSAIFTRTGYTQTGWATSNGGSQLCALGGNYTSDADATLYPVWTANNYTVILDNREADIEDGTESVSVTFDATTGLTSTIDKPEKKHYDFGGYYTSANSGATLDVQLIDENGNWKKGVSGYTGTSEDNATWVYAGDITLYAKWTEHEYAVTLAISPAGAGTTSPASSTTAKYVTASADITATPSTGYSFREWGFSKTDEKYDVYVSDDKTYSSTDATIKINAQHNGTLIANFIANGYTVNLENKGADKDHKGTENVSVTYNAITGLTSAIEKPEKAHYDFGGYYVSNDEGETLTNIQLIDASGNWNKGVSGYTGTSGDYATWVYAGNITLYAKWTETAYTITPSVSPAGTGSVNTVTDAHWITPSSTITATPVNAAWVFDRWEYGEHVGPSTVSGNTVTVTSDMNSTITAHFKPRYELVGCIWDNSGNGGMPGWSYDGTGEFTVNSFTALGTGEGTGVDLSYSCTLWANTTYKFEVHDRVTGNHGKYYAAGQYLNDGEHALLNQKNNDVPLAAIGAGTYTFRITNMTYDGITDDYFPTITVERPHQMHMGHKRVDIDGTSHSDDTGGTLTASTGGNSLANGDWYNYGANITYTASAQSGYTLTWYTNDSYTSEFPQQPAATWPHDNVTGDENVYAKFTEKSTAVTFSSTNGKVQIASTDKANTTVGITTSREITAVPNTGYSFSSWTVPGGADFSVESTSSATTTLSGLGAGTAGTLTANFTENMHAVTVTAGSGGSVSSDPALSDGKVTIGITTSATLTATPANAAWVFKNWTGDIDDGITIASGSATSAMITINATADSKSITANFEPRYGLHGSLANDTPGGMPGWTGDGADFAVGSFSGIGEGDGKGVDLQCARTLEPNKEYKFRIYDRAADGRWGYSSSVTLGAGESLELSTYGDVSGKDVTIYTVGYGTYTFKITNMYDNGDGKYYPKVTVDRPTSYQFNMGCTEGGTVTAATTAGSGYAITNGQYVAAGDDIQFHAVPAAGYAFDHWYTASDYATSFNDNKDMKMNNISETVNAYAKFVPVTVTYNDGSGDGKWSTASNWSPACVPTIDHDVVITKPVTVDIAHATAKSIVLDQNSNTGKLTIDANQGLEVVGTITRTTDGSDRLATREEDLVLESSSAGNASLIFNNSNSCAATVQMYSKATISGSTWNWQYVGTPFAGSIPQYNYYGSWMYKWNGTTQGWDVVGGYDELTPFAGYCLTQNSATTHVMGGTLVATDGNDQVITMSATTDMVLANSWTAPIWIGGFTASTFTSTPATIYMFNTGMAENGSKAGTAEAGTYEAKPINSAPFIGNGLIAPMQGFFVTTVDGSAGTITLKYNELVRPHNNRQGDPDGIVSGPMFAQKREVKPDVMKIMANGTLYSDHVFILAREDFSEGFDNGWDGEKLSFGAEAPSVYVINQEGGYDAVSAIPGFEGTLVGFRAGTNNSCTMTFEYDGEEIWYLNDLQTQQSTLIDSELTYTFSTSSYDSEARFIISATPIRKITTGVETVTGYGLQGTGVRKLIINDKIYIIRRGRMFTVDGQMVK